MQPAALDKLQSVVGAEHVLTGVKLSPYVVDGRTPDVAVRPGTVEEIREVMTLASDTGTPVMPWGGGTASAVGSPPGWSGLVLELCRLDRMLEHEPGDLTVTVEAGATVATLQAKLGAAQQWLSLDPPDAERATIGGVIAANASGPRRHLYGTARDLLIGVTVITAHGALVRGGGKVVKNVAGYDLPKLFVGSYGTLGVIAEVTLKLRPLPDDERLVAVTFDDLKNSALAARALGSSDLIPNAVELLDAAAGRTIGLGGPVSLVVGFDGLTEQVEWQTTELSRLAAGAGGRDARPLPRDTWGRLAAAARHAFDTPAAVARFAVLPSQVADTMEQGQSAARVRGFRSAWSAHAGVGVVTAALAAGGAEEDLTPLAAVVRDWREIAHGNGGYATLEWAPLALKAVIAVWDDIGAAARIMTRIKQQVDPKNILNPGRFLGAA